MEIFVFGSFVRGDFGPNSDVDLLVISPNTSIPMRAKLLSSLDEIIGTLHPFEIHLITPEQYEEWYSHFIKEKMKV